MLDAHASVLITADAVWRGAKLIALKEIVDDGMMNCNILFLPSWDSFSLNGDNKFRLLVAMIDCDILVFPSCDSFTLEGG